MPKEAKAKLPKAVDDTHGAGWQAETPAAAER